MPGTTRTEIVIVASLIEPEAKVDEDRPLIASVIDNRLRHDMPLQIDATVLYARGGGTGSLTDADSPVDSPYNTYRQRACRRRRSDRERGVADRPRCTRPTSPYLYYVLTDTNGQARVRDHLRGASGEHRRCPAAGRAQ